MGPSSTSTSTSKEFDDHNDPCLVSLNLDKFIMNNYKLDHEPLINSAEENMLQRNPSSCSSSSSPPIIYENPLEMRNIEEDFLQNPMMTKIDEEYMKWQQGMVDSDLKVLESNGFHEKCGDDSSFDQSDRNNECSMERRQRRMIKNRESAARSRARKQAYIDQLQHRASQLQTSKKLLKKRKEACAIWNSSSISAPRYQLRRISSAHF